MFVLFHLSKTRLSAPTFHYSSITSKGTQNSRFDGPFIVIAHNNPGVPRSLPDLVNVRHSRMSVKLIISSQRRHAFSALPLFLEMRFLFCDRLYLETGGDKQTFELVSAQGGKTLARGLSPVTWGFFQCHEVVANDKPRAPCVLISIHLDGEISSNSDCVLMD